MIASPADGDEAVTAWRSSLARAATADEHQDLDERTAALLDSELVDMPASVLVPVLAAWGGPPPRPTEAARGAIGALPRSGDTRAGSALTVASYLAVLDDAADEAAIEVVTRLASEDAVDLVALEDALLSTDDPALAATTQQATLLLSA